MTAEQVLRAFIIKEMNDYDYATLAYKLADSVNFEKFCGTDAIVPRVPDEAVVMDAYLDQPHVRSKDLDNDALRSHEMLSTWFSSAWNADHQSHGRLCRRVRGHHGLLPGLWTHK